jgi:SAM-dependent methyltransferase
MLSRERVSNALSRRIRRWRHRVRVWIGTRVLRNEHVGQRSSGRSALLDGDRVFRKQFRAGQTHALEMELLAREVFAGSPWLVPVLRVESDAIVLPQLPPDRRLDLLAPRLSASERREVAHQAVEASFDMFCRGYAHRDFHAKNLFWVDGQLYVIDFEAMAAYDVRPAFPESYDMVGRGMPSPYQTHHKCYVGGENPQSALQTVLGVPVEDALAMLRDRILRDLRQTSSTFQSKRRRHECALAVTYGSFHLPYMQVGEDTAQRHTAARIRQFGVSEAQLANRTVLDLGSNIGTFLFELQKLGPSACHGIEIDRDKVRVAGEVAAFNGLDRVTFEQGNLEMLAKTPDQVGQFDVVSCLAVVEHLEDKEALYRLLGQVTRETLLFEGNSTTDPDFAESRLRAAGFADVRFLGRSGDDSRAENNVRPMFVATK